jgi:hypothetical protein
MSEREREGARTPRPEEGEVDAHGFRRRDERDEGEISA